MSPAQLPLDQVLDELATLGEEKSRRVSSVDVTEQVVDLQAELESKRALRASLRALLSRAKDVQEALAVEQQVARVQLDIDRLEARLKQTSKDVALSAVDLTLSQTAGPQPKRILGPLGYLWVGTKWFITKLFVIRPGQA